jgi:hypothetical protein
MRIQIQELLKFYLKSVSASPKLHLSCSEEHQAEYSHAKAFIRFVLSSEHVEYFLC